MPYTPGGAAGAAEGTYEAGMITEEEYAMMAEQEEEFIHEAEWGAGKEQGVGEEVENDME